MAKTEKAKTLPKVSILDRRLLNPFGTGSVPITLKTPGQWAIRWVLTNLRGGHLWDMTHNKGWEYVEPSEIDGVADELGLTSSDNRLVRGDAGSREVLMKMPQDMFDQIQAAKADANMKQLKVKNMRSAVAQAAAKQMGDKAGDGVYDAFQHGEIKDSRGIAADLEESA
jgi:hypothetical protein